LENKGSDIIGARCNHEVHWSTDNTFCLLY